MQQKFVNYYYGFVFGIPAVIGVTCTRKYIVPNLPDTILGLTKENAIMIFFVFIMLLAALSMLLNKSNVNSSKRNNDQTNGHVSKYPLIILEGLVLGAITGLVGAGGGFLIIPALYFLAKLSMKEAVGTSLFIITIKSLVGFFVGDVTTMPIDWTFLLPFSALSIIGILIGVSLSKHIPSTGLKKSFGIFLIIMSCYVTYKTFLC